MNNGVVRDRDNNFSRHQTFKDGVTIEGGLTVDITGGSNAEETADFTAEVGKVYVVDTSSTAVTATLPASPAALEEVTFLDGAKTFNSNALTVNMNGKKLDGATVSTKVHTTKGGAFKYIYRNATYGWLLKAFVFMMFALNIHAGDFTYEMNSWEQDGGLSIGTDKLKPRTAGELLSIADSAGTTVATITTSAMTITTATITGLTATVGSISTLDSSTSQIGTLSLTTALTVSNGGTGLSSLAAGRIPYGAGIGALANSANFAFESNRLNLQNDSGAQLRLTDSTGNYTDFRTDSYGNFTVASTGFGFLYGKVYTPTGWDGGSNTIYVDVPEIVCDPGKAPGIYKVQVSAFRQSVGLVYAENTMAYISVYRKIAAGLAKTHIKVTEVFKDNALTLGSLWYDTVSETEQTAIENTNAHYILRIKISGFVDQPSFATGCKLRLVRESFINY